MGSKSRAGKVSEVAVVAGVGAAVFLGWGCAVASASVDSPSDAADSSSASDSSESASSESAQRTDERSDTRDEKSDEDAGDDDESLPRNDDRDAAPADDEPDETTDDDSPTVHTDLNPPEDTSPPPPAPTATAQWTMLGAARREAETEDVAPSVGNPVELQTTSEAVPAAPANSVVYTAEPTASDQVTAAGHGLVAGLSRLIGVDLHGLITTVLQRDHPPSFLTHGLDARKTEYQVSLGNTWQVWELHPPNPTGKTVVVVHDGTPLLTHWLDYTNMARDTGATVIVPMYPPATTDAAMAQFISHQIDRYDAEDVSIYADSAGTVRAMSALRQLVANGRPVPASMVLLSPAPGIQDGFAGLPPTTIYVGSVEEGLTDTLALQQEWAAAGGVVSVVVGRGQIHDWALGGSVNSQSSVVRPDIYRQLGLNSAGTGPITITTSPPSFGDQLVVWALRTLRWFSEVTGIKLFSGVAGSVVSKSPPPSTTTGLIVTERDYNGWTVWELASDQPSGEYVVALHGGGFESEANIIHWSDYASMVRDTGATVLVPIYPLAPPQGTGTATTLVPPMADYLSMLIDEHGVDNVSLYGDSAGGSLGLLAVQEMLRRCRSDVLCVPDEEMPSRMVLVSPALHLTLTGPEIDAIDDPILPRRAPGDPGPQFNGELDMDDPRVNPISSADLTGLPPTTVYIGTVEKLYPGALAFRDKLLAQDPDADFTVIIGDGQIHGWALGGIFVNSQTSLWRPTVYRQLGLFPEDVSLISIAV